MLFPLLRILRNPFPASYLKLKSLNYIQKRRSSSRICATSVVDIARKNSNILTSLLPNPSTERGLRRPRSKRKRDWDAAMEQLTLPLSKKMKSTLRREPDDIIPLPILPTYITSMAVHSIIDYPEVPALFPVLPSRTVSVPTVEA